MGLHSSLKRAEKLTATRSVMKRTERIKWLREKGMWKDETRVVGLPKIKVARLKVVKKEKKAEAKPGEGTAAASATAPAKTAPAKAASAKKTT